MYKVGVTRRSIIEKTRGDLTTAMRQHELHDALARVEKTITAGME